MVCSVVPSRFLPDVLKRTKVIGKIRMFSGKYLSFLTDQVLGDDNYIKNRVEDVRFLVRRLRKPAY